LKLSKYKEPTGKYARKPRGGISRVSAARLFKEISIQPFCVMLARQPASSTLVPRVPGDSGNFAEAVGVVPNSRAVKTFPTGRPQKLAVRRRGLPSVMARILLRQNETRINYC
jgi:hypothetical protein